MDPKIRTEFQIVSKQLSPEEITDQLGIVPTRKLYLGDLIGGSQIRMKANIWCFSVCIQEETLNASDYLTPLVESLLPIKEKILKLYKNKQISCVIECGLHIIEQTPILDLTPVLLLNIAELNANLDIDIILTE